MPEARSRREATSTHSPCLGRDRGDDVIFAEADGHPAILAAHDGPEYSDTRVSRVFELALAIVGETQFEPHFRAFRQDGVRAKIGAAGGYVNRFEGDFSLCRGSRQGLDCRRDHEIVTFVFPSLNHKGSLSLSCMEAVYRVGDEIQAGKKYDFV